MTDITLGQPLGGFYWRGTIPGQLCGATVTWACTYESDEPIAIPPFIDYAGQHVIVTNQLPDGLGVPSYVSPGVLTLTPTVTCPNPDPGGDPIATVLDPIFLTITESGASAPCTPVIPAFPLNPGFETGSLSPWTSTHGEISTTQPHAGTYSFSFSDEAPVNVTLTQEIMGFELCAAMDVTMRFYAQPRFVDNTLSYNVELLDSGGGVLYTLQRTDISSPTGVWTHHNANMAMGEATALQTKGFRINVTTNADDMYVDDFTFVLT